MSKPQEIMPGPEHATEMVFRVTAMGDGSVLAEVGRVSVDTVAAALRAIADGIERGGIVPTFLN